MNALAKARKASTGIEAARSTTEPRMPGGAGRVYWLPRNNSGSYVDEQTAMTYAAAWAAINLISHHVASLPWDIQQKIDGDKKTVVLTSDPLRWLLNFQPDQDATMSAFRFRACIMAHALSWGGGYAEIERTRAGRPLKLHLITPDRVIPKRDDTLKLYYQVSNEGRAPSFIPAEDMLHIVGPSYDGAVGYSPVKLFRNNIGLGMSTERYSASLFGNGANPGGVLQTDKPLKEETKRNLRESWNEIHQGPDGAGRVAILEDGLKWSGVSLPPQLAELINTRKFGISDVSRIWGVPPHKLFDLERSTNNNIEQQAIEFVTDCLMRWVISCETEADVKLVGRDRVLTGVRTRMRLDGLLRGDSQTLSQVNDRYFKMGAKSVNEVRADLGLDPVVDGDLRMVPMNMCPLEKAKDSLPMKGAPSGTDKGGPPDGEAAATPIK